MSDISLIDKVYNFLKESKNNVLFEEIWNNISKDVKIKNKDLIMAELYSELVLDNRFALTSDGKWGLRDYLKFDDVKKQYDYIDKFITTEDFDSTAQYHDDDDNVTKIININEKLDLKEKFEDLDDLDNDYDFDEDDDYEDDFDFDDDL